MVDISWAAYFDEALKLAGVAGLPMVVDPEVVRRQTAARSSLAGMATPVRRGAGLKSMSELGGAFRPGTTMTSQIPQGTFERAFRPGAATRKMTLPGTRQQIQAAAKSIVPGPVPAMADAASKVTGAGSRLGGTMATRAGVPSAVSRAGSGSKGIMSKVLRKVVLRR